MGDIRSNIRTVLDISVISTKAALRIVIWSYEGTNEMKLHCGNESLHVTMPHLKWDISSIITIPALDIRDRI